jgi:ATP-independent RNA helicase DbpA
MTEPVMAQVASTHDNRSIAQHFYRVTDDQQRQRALCLLLLQNQPVSTLVFCNTKVDTRQVAQGLRDSGFSVLALHGDLEQRDRDEILVRFSNKSVSVLVATDVAARGLDIDSLDAVINYRIALDVEMHIHRVGRTGRAGSKGVAFSLYDEGEAHRVASLDTTVDPIMDSELLPSLDVLEHRPMVPPMATVQIDGGKKQKVRPGDILGALTGPGGIRGDQVGKIQIADQWAYVAVSRESAGAALKKLSAGKLKGRAVRVRLIK